MAGAFDLNILRLTIVVHTHIYTSLPFWGSWALKWTFQMWECNKLNYSVIFSAFTRWELRPLGCVCVSVSRCYRPCFCPLCSRCVFCHNTKSCWLWFTTGSSPGVSHSWRQDLMEREASDRPQWNRNQSHSLWALIRVLELFWNIPACESLSLPDCKHPSRRDLYSSFLIMLFTIQKLRRENGLSLKFD